MVAGSSVELTPIGECCELINGRAFKSSEWRSSGIPIVRIQNLNDSSKEFNFYEGQVEEKHSVDSGDLLFAWSGTPGTSFGAHLWNRGRAALNQHIFKVVLDESRIDKSYFRYALNHVLDRIIDQAHGGVGLKHITKKKLVATKVPVLPLSEQKRIVSILGKADAIRRKRQQATALTEDLLRSTFTEIFGDPVINSSSWPLHTLGTLLEGIEGGWSPVCESRAAAGSEWGVLKLGAVTFGRYDHNENKALRPGSVPRPELEVKQGDLLFSRKNTHEHVAAIVLVGNTRPRLMIPDLVFRLRAAAGAGVTPTYLWAVLSHSGIRSAVQRLASGAAGSMPNISKARLREFEVPVPTVALQERFERAFAQITELESRMKQSVSCSEDLFGSLSERAFRGEL